MLVDKIFESLEEHKNEIKMIKGKDNKKEKINDVISNVVVDDFENGIIKQNILEAFNKNGILVSLYYSEDKEIKKANEVLSYANELLKEK